MPGIWLENLRWPTWIRHPECDKARGRRTRNCTVFGKHKRPSSAFEKYGREAILTARMLSKRPNRQPPGTFLTKRLDPEECRSSMLSTKLCKSFPTIRQPAHWKSRPESGSLDRPSMIILTNLKRLESCTGMGQEPLSDEPTSGTNGRAVPEGQRALL